MYYVHKKKRHTAEKGLSNYSYNPAYARELITVASSTHGDFETEANPAYSSIITHPQSSQSKLNSEYEEINNII